MVKYIIRGLLFTATGVLYLSLLTWCIPISIGYFTLKTFSGKVVNKSVYTGSKSADYTFLIDFGKDGVQSMNTNGGDYIRYDIGDYISYRLSTKYFTGGQWDPLAPMVLFFIVVLPLLVACIYYGSKIVSWIFTPPRKYNNEAKEWLTR